MSGSARDRETLGFQLTIWRARGALWWTTLLSVLVAHAAGRCSRFASKIRLISPASDSWLRFSTFPRQSHPRTPRALSPVSLLYGLGPNILSFQEC